MKFGFEVAKKYYDHDHKTKKNARKRRNKDTVKSESKKLTKFLNTLALRSLFFDKIEYVYC